MTVAPGSTVHTTTACLTDIASGLRVLRHACDEAAECYRLGDLASGGARMSAIVNGVAITVTAAGYAAPHVRFATADGELTALAATTASHVRRLTDAHERHAWGTVAGILEGELASVIGDWIAAFDGAMLR